MPVTMAEIDRLRGMASWAVEYRRIAIANGTNPPQVEGRDAVEVYRGRVEAALREWWAQGCREVGPRDGSRIEALEVWAVAVGTLLAGERASLATERIGCLTDALASLPGRRPPWLPWDPPGPTD